MCDCTGSMGSYIHAAQQNIKSIVHRIAEEHEANVRFALISYRDHPPQDSSYVTQCFPFTGSEQEMLRYVSTMSANGGGDGPEAVTAALSDALCLPWRPNATKVAVLIADAPPHGLEPSGDGFPNGDPEGRDPLDIARRMAALGITCYSVGVEPVLGQYRFARDFMCTIAEITGGQAVALSSAALLADVIVNGSAEEISLMKLQREVETEIQQVQAAAAAVDEVLSTDETCSRAWASLQAKGVKSVQMTTDGGMTNSLPGVWHKQGAAHQSLAGAKAELMAQMPPQSAAVSLRLPGIGRTWGPPGYREASMGMGMGAPSGPPACMDMLGGAPPPPFPAAFASCPAPAGMGGPPGASPLMAMGGVAPPTAASCPPPKTSTTNTLSMGMISMSQVERIMTKQQHQMGPKSSPVA